MTVAVSRIESDAPAPDEDFARAVIEGLSQTQKTLPCRFFYDARGSALFEEITELPEYYPTRTETAVLSARAPDLMKDFPSGGVIVEFGSGSSRKTEILLAETRDLAAYVAIDVSPSALADAQARLRQHFPRVPMVPIVGDFTRPIALPNELAKLPKLGFFPGSTIGNFLPSDARTLLANMGESLGARSRLVIGADLKKDLDILLPAYDDAAGVTAAFNLNLLRRINAELGGDFELRRFFHDARYNEVEGRIEMHLVSRVAQKVSLLGHVFAFASGETIHTENSHKYTVDEFAAMARIAGWATRHVYTDADRLFSVHDLVRASQID
ncbi:MAG TPA: L-histidine N(alpha)-methyltransferase [Beijerinckiaceae bacterium]|jgi:dimethylhistidine N-methyltransferase|nr:L-histidine N(alpha)-methyltransferase [Beijerinckiaceae bacterium]